jgi:copper chaperone CopZ
MKTKTIIALLSLLFIIAKTGVAQKTEKYIEVKIKTSAVCDMCKTAIENSLVFSKGVKKADLNVETKIVTVVYNSDKTTVDAIKKTINNTGYDADDLPANEKKYKKLPACCKKDSNCNGK